MKNTTKTAATDYSQRAAITQDLLKRIADRLSEHQARQTAQPGDWSYAGDLGRVNEELAQVLAALGDRSGINELGLKYWLVGNAASRCSDTEPVARQSERRRNIIPAVFLLSSQILLDRVPQQSDEWWYRRSTLMNIENTQELRDALFHAICLLDHANPENDTDHRDVAAARELARLRDLLNRQAYEPVAGVPEGKLATKRGAKKWIPAKPQPDTPIDRAKAEDPLAAAAQLQAAFWDALLELEGALGGIEIDGNRDLSEASIDELLVEE